MRALLPILAVVALTISLADAQSQVKKSTIPGITNFSQVETTVACAGATTPGSVAGIKKMGFASIINLRLATEAGADIDGKQRQPKPLALPLYTSPSMAAHPTLR